MKTRILFLFLWFQIFCRLEVLMLSQWSPQRSSTLMVLEPKLFVWPADVRRTGRGRRGRRCAPPGYCRRDSGTPSAASSTASWGERQRRDDCAQVPAELLQETSHPCQAAVLGADVVAASLGQDGKAHEAALPLVGVVTGEAGLGQRHLRTHVG